jgi:hypothetical protein
MKNLIIIAVLQAVLFSSCSQLPFVCEEVEAVAEFIECEVEKEKAIPSHPQISS